MQCQLEDAERLVLRDEQVVRTWRDTEGIQLASAAVQRGPIVDHPLLPGTPVGSGRRELLGLPKP